MKRKFTNRPTTARYLLCLALFIALPSLAFEQEDSKISLNLQNTPITKVLHAIEDQSGCTFFYSGGTIDSEALVSIKVTKTPLNKVLDELLKPLKVEYQFKNKAIVLKKVRRASILEEAFAVLDTSSDVSVRGKVMDSKGNPMVGVTVSIKGKSINAITDDNGNFQLYSVKANSTLVFSNVGFENQEIKIKNSTVVNISLKERITDLQKVEVVSTGYQEIPKERATGSFAQVDNATFNRRVSSNVLDRLDDNVPGLLNLKNQSRDQLKNYQIRGIATINAETKPLLVIDNFIYEGDPKLINPNDVENITVLRDAAAASIWGVRAGNGVIVISTKKGKTNKKATISFNANYTIRKEPDFSTIPSIPSTNIVELEKKRFQSGYYDNILSSPYISTPLPEVAEILNKVRTGKLSQFQGDQLLAELSNSDIRNDLNKYLYKSSTSQQYNLNVAGGSNNYQYYASFGFDKSHPSEINVKDQRITLRINNTWQPIKKLNITTEINITKSDLKSKNANTTGINPAIKHVYNKLYNNDGTPNSIAYKYRKYYIDTLNTDYLFDWHYYPLQESENADISEANTVMRIMGMVEYTIIKGLKASIQYQYQNSNGENKKISSLNTFENRDAINRFANFDPQNNIIVYPIPIGSKYVQSYNKLNSWDFRTNLNYSRSFGKSSINAIAGWEVREIEQEIQQMPEQFGFDENTNTFQNLKYGFWPERPNNFITELTPNLTLARGYLNRFGGYFSNASYNYDQKYTISISGRVDQSNFFGVKANDRIVPLWSAGLLWDISNEGFYKSNKIPFLQLRATYGYNGNVTPGTSPFATAQYYQPAPPTNLPYATIVTAPNPVLRWEKVRNINLGLDFGLAQNVLSGSIELYKKNGIDLISPIVSAPSTGFKNFNGNNASIVTKGIDIDLKNRNAWGKIRFNNQLRVSYNTNKVTKYRVPPPPGFQDPLAYTYSIPIEGKPLDRIYTYNWAGLDPSNGDAMLYIDGKKVNSTEYTTAILKDLIYSGRMNPTYFGSFRTELAYKNLEISLGLNFNFGSKFIRSSFDGIVQDEANFNHIDYLEAWKKSGDEKTTNVPQFLDSYPDNRYMVYNQSSILVERGDNIRLQDIRLSYDLTSHVSSRLMVTGANVFLYLDNVCRIWKASAVNPDTKNALEYNPNLRSICLGLNIKL